MVLRLQSMSECIRPRHVVAYSRALHTIDEQPGCSNTYLSPPPSIKSWFALRAVRPIDDAAGVRVELVADIIEDGAGVKFSAAVGSALGVVTWSGAGVASDKKFSYQTTRALSQLEDTKSRSSSPSRSVAIT